MNHRISRIATENMILWVARQSRDGIHLGLRRAWFRTAAAVSRISRIERFLWRYGRFAYVDSLACFGVTAVSAMATFYALEDRGAHFVLAFAEACLLASSYGFMQGAWPFGVVEAIWALIAVQRWRVKVSGTARTEAE